ncbi:hypothetical protein LEMLEM_LOCUS4160, partial [Lemmus lemmus]
PVSCKEVISSLAKQNQAILQSSQRLATSYAVDIPDFPLQFPWSLKEESDALSFSSSNERCFTNARDQMSSAGSSSCATDPGPYPRSFPYPAGESASQSLFLQQKE